MCIDGDTKYQAEALQAKCDTILKAFQRCRMTPEDAWQGYQSIYLPAVSYPLTATAIRQDTLHKIQQQITFAILLDTTVTYRGPLLLHLIH